MNVIVKIFIIALPILFFIALYFFKTRQDIDDMNEKILKKLSEIESQARDIVYETSDGCKETDC